MARRPPYPGCGGARGGPRTHRTPARAGDRAGLPVPRHPHGAHFRAHRDNTTKGTAHRRFAVTINRNAGEFEGGELCFPEFGPLLYRAPTGGAVVFSCSLLHEARPVTAGRRYAFLPFLYDEAAAVQLANDTYLGAGVDAYRADGAAAADAEPASPEPTSERSSSAAGLSAPA